jgi:hypothetical protein
MLTRLFISLLTGEISAAAASCAVLAQVKNFPGRGELFDPLGDT